MLLVAVEEGWVDPRVCGGARSRAEALGMKRGRSPRVRGSLSSRVSRALRSRSIPACAGEPLTTVMTPSIVEVDPRVCGGALTTTYIIPPSEGRSPRVRGSPKSKSSVMVPYGSIPACAGEPIPVEHVSVIRRVDPRVCGGAELWADPAMRATGRSPRVRGSPSASRSNLLISRSIPACAGEPEGGDGRRGLRRVDPRVCGGAYSRSFIAVRRAGRSPRVRGSPGTPPSTSSRPGSIPACAGEPFQSSFVKSLERVDPRVCGGAHERQPVECVASGRSPRVRGSPISA